MRPSQIRKALDDYAARQLPGQPDLWPAVRREVLQRHPATGRIHIEPLGRRRGALLPALIVLLLVAAFALAPWLNRGDVPVPAATPSPTGAALPGAATAMPALTAEDSAYLADLLAQKLGARLGVDQGKLDAAINAATLDTIDQAVRAGQLTPAQAAQAKARASQGLAAFFRNGFDGSGTGFSSNGVRALLDQLGLAPGALSAALEGTAK
jgi:hypothetical protein